MKAILHLVFKMPQYGMDETREVELCFSSDFGWSQESLKDSLQTVTLDGIEFQVTDVSVQLNKFDVLLMTRRT